MCVALVKKKIWLKPSCFVPEVEMIFTLPDNVNSENYINDFLKSIFNEEMLLNCEWDFVDAKESNCMYIKIIGEDISKEEKQAYLDHATQKYGDALEGLDICVDGDEVELTYRLRHSPFERVRRITGYLVGTLDRWNNAKQAEERDRVKHDV